MATRNPASTSLIYLQRFIDVRCRISSIHRKLVLRECTIHFLIFLPLDIQTPPEKFFLDPKKHHQQKNFLRCFGCLFWCIRCPDFFLRISGITHPAGGADDYFQVAPRGCNLAGPRCTRCGRDRSIEANCTIYGQLNWDSSLDLCCFFLRIHSRTLGFPG